MSDIVSRHLMGFAERMLHVFPILVIQGARRVGKTTFAKQLAEGRQHVLWSLDDDEARSQAMNDPRTFASQGGEGLLVVDEVQRAPELLLAIKAYVDRDPRPGRFVLTGSSDLMRIAGTPDSLAGRAVTVPLKGFSQGEMRGIVDDFAARVHEQPWGGFTTDCRREDYTDIVCRGSYPEAIRLDDRDQRVWMTNYLDRLLRLDVRALGRALSAERLALVMRLISVNQAGEMVLARLADQIGVTAPTIREYVDILQTMYLVSSLPPWTPNLTRREVGRKKVLVDDSGLAAVLNKVTPSKLVGLESAEHFGLLLEGLVISELRKQQAWTSEPFELYHFRDSDGLEVDLVMEFDDGRVFLIEVKASQTYRSQYFKAMKTLAEQLGSRFVGGAVLGTSNTSFRYSENMWGLPIATLWA